MKKTITKVLCIYFIFTLTMIPVHASTGIQPYFTNINVFYNDFDISSSGKASVTSSVSARNADQVKVTAYLQRYQNGSWTTVKSWSITEDGLFTGLGETWYVASGYQYRMTSYAYVYKAGSLVDSTSYTSSSIIY